MGRSFVKKRIILFVTGSRGEYGYIRPIIRLIEKDPLLDYIMVVTNMHLVPVFGSTINEIEKDGITIHYAPEMTLGSYTSASMMKSLCLFGLSITDILDKEKPDIILLSGDRGEQFITAMTSAHLNIPVAHIQAGEVSGNIDGQTRHAIARYAHIHFAANEDAAIRLEKSGEQSFRIFNVGAPQLDEFLQSKFISREKIFEKYHLDPEKPFILLAQHPVTEEFERSGQQMETTLLAIDELGIQTVLIFPNSDAGSTATQVAIQKYVRPFIHVYRNVSREHYAGLMAAADIMVGNSSSGLLEAPSFKLPAVNIGRRQLGRVRGENVIDCNYDKEEIINASKKGLSAEFKNSVKDIENR